MDGLTLQPCCPTFLNTRDAILLTEKTLSGVKYQGGVGWLSPSVEYV